MQLLRRAIGSLRQPASVLDDYAEFSGISISAIKDRLTNFSSVNAREWIAHEQHNSHFYIESANYIYDTLSANRDPHQLIAKLNRFNPAIMTSIKDHPGKTFLDFGAGIGLMCEVAARAGKHVTYQDLPGVVFDFARWRFKKHGLAVAMIQADPETINIRGKFDIVYTDAVIEHFAPALQDSATDALALAVNNGGLLILLVDLSGPTEREPMHFYVDIHTLHDRLKRHGLKCESGLSTFCSLWRK